MAKQQWKTVTSADAEGWEDKLFEESEKMEYGDVEEELDTPILVIDLDEVNGEAKRMAELITQRLSNYYFDQSYVDKHPYIATKIMTEMDNIRRLIKMLSVNEKAQDALISNITMNAGKGSLYAALTSLQNSMLNIQKQLNELTTSIENIFREMQDDAEKNFQEKDKEGQSDDGTLIVRGSRDFIKELNERLYGKPAEAVE